MKKAKILVPAIAAMILSVAAAGTGTYAWFTATRTASVGTTGKSAIATEGNLDITISAGKGTTYGGDGKTGKVTHGALTDGSIDMTTALNTGTVGCYGAQLKDDGTQTVEKYLDCSTDFLAMKEQVNGASIYRATEFQVIFKLDLTNVGAGAKYGLFFDGNVSSTPVTSFTAAKTVGDIAPAFRIGMFSVAGEVKNARVIQPYAGTSAPLTHVKSGDKTSATGSYAATMICNASKVTTYDKTTKADAEKNLVGTFLKEGNVNTITVKFYTWFEGEDENCVVPQSPKKLEANAIDYTLNFNVVKYDTSKDAI